MSSILWQASEQQQQASRLYAFMRRLNRRHNLTLSNYDELYAWSIQNPECFWQSLVDDYTLFDRKHCKTLTCPADSTMFNCRWFEGARLNFAEKLLSRRDDQLAVDFYNEAGVHQQLSYAELYDQVAKLAHALRNAGIESGDRVAAILPDIPEALIAMLATTSLGAIWSCCSPDFGKQAILDRFTQISPRVLISCDGYYYKGKSYPKGELFDQVADELDSLQLHLRVDYLKTPSTQKATDLAVFMDNSVSEITFYACAFSDPLYILYSSGTTGVPKCIVHGVGGTLLQHIKELSLHCDLKPAEKLFYYTSTGWMMWNWMASGLALGVTLVLYDGSPFYPAKSRLFELVREAEVDVFGCGARYLASLHREALDLRQLCPSCLRLILSTGSPLLAETFDYVYQKIKDDVQLSSISGGTDIVSCFALGNPLTPVLRGELQRPGLAMKVEVWDEQARSVTQQKGELVCTAPFPSMPVCFWSDEAHQRYAAAYFEKYSGVWAHGDYAEITASGGVIIYGRSDATLNPGGIRIGTAEIYRQLEKFTQVIDALVIAQQWQGDQRIILFIQLDHDMQLNEALQQSIRDTIRQNTSVHHVPAMILPVTDIPRTYSGKIAEIAVTRVIHGEPVTNLNALVNPESLEQFKQFKELYHE